MYKRISLNGQWDFVADLDPKYHDDKHDYPNPPYSLPDTNRRHWKKVPVPGVWQKYGERYDIFEGVCWFAREFYLDMVEFTHAHARFGGVNYQCDVYINGQHAGSHEGGYTEFVLDTAKYLHRGENHIAVRVDNRVATIKWPPCLGYFNYGGIHRDVVLELSDGPYMADITLSNLPGEEGFSLLVEASVKGNGSAQLTLHICCDGKSETSPVIDGSVKSQLCLPDVKCWSPESPILYPVKLTLKNGGILLDEREILYGFKTIAVKNRVIILNGQPYTLNGSCYVYDSPISGLTMTPEQVKTDVRLMKEMGANAVRCHYPMDKTFYAVCDHLGLLVWTEPPVYCYHPGDEGIGTRFSDDAWLSLANNMIAEMIRVAKNHPSVAIYGIGNECNTNNKEAEAFFTSLAATVRREDPARLVSYAALYGIVGPLAKLVDVLGVNSYWGWYDKVFGGKGLSPAAGHVTTAPEREPIDLQPMRNMLDKVIKDENEDLVLLLTEFGADSVPGYYAVGRDLWSENYHAELLDEIFKLSDEYPQIAGTFPFCFTDYRDPSKTSNGYWNEINLKGAVSYNRKKKLAFDAIQKRYMGK